MKALVTGIEGFVGPHLASFLEKQGLEIFGTYHHSNEPKKNHYQLDITNRSEVFQLIEDLQPDYLFHLAGFSSVKKSFEEPEQCKKINVEGTRNILDAIKENSPQTKILIISSAEVYGKPSSLPINENHSLSVKSPYGESRIQQEALCQEYIQKHGLFIIISRSFNHTGPGQEASFVIPSFAKQIALIEKGEQKSIKVGNLDIIRDFSDVRDIVKAYYLALTRGKKGEIYNICSGKGYVLKELLQKLTQLARTPISIETDPDRMRPNDIPTLIGDNTKIKETINWQPVIEIDRMLKDLLDYWRVNLF